MTLTPDQREAEFPPARPDALELLDALGFFTFSDVEDEAA